MRDLATFAFISALTIVSIPSSVLAAWQPNGIPVAPVGQGVVQSSPNLCTDELGGAYVTWKEQTSSDQGDPYLQRVTADGDIALGWPVRGVRIGTHPNSEFVCNLAPD